MSILEELVVECRDFATKRDWLQFHTPKNLAMAVAGEAGELVAEFQWLTSLESERANLSADQLEAIKFEMADVAIYLLRLSDVLGIDLATSIREKLTINSVRFPEKF